MIIENEIKEIKKYLSTDKFSAKVQQVGMQSGRPKYMIYITGIAKKLGLTKGDILEFSIKKIGHEKTRVPKQAFGKEVEAREPPVPSIGVVPDVVIQKDEPQDVVGTSLEQAQDLVDEPNEAEQKFIVKFNKANESDNPTMAEFLKKQAEKEFGTDRVQELLK